MAKKLALLGDSTIDNRSYVAPGPDTHTLTVRTLGPEWSVELLAVDGAVMSDIHRQLRGLPHRCDVAVLSVGGNDALGHASLLDQPVSSVAEVLTTLDEIREVFARGYRALIEKLYTTVPRVVLCTIYEPPMYDDLTRRVARVVLSVLNDQIIRAATSNGLEVIDLRLVCTERADFVQAIEPSAAGAAKIADVIARIVASPKTAAGSRVFAW